MELRLRACRFRFRAVDSVFFPPHKAGNVLRGALGGVAAGDGSRRPFVLRAAHLNGMRFGAGEAFICGANVFDPDGPTTGSLKDACAAWATTGLGPRRGRVELLAADDEIVAIDLQPGSSASRCSLRFCTPTSLKGNPSRDDIPFPILFARLRERISALFAIYDDRPLGDRASDVRTIRRDLRYQAVERRSSRTGAVHGIGGLVGRIEYAGDLTEFLPWLRAAWWTGVGRHTVWGNGVVEVMHAE